MIFLTTLPLWLVGVLLIGLTTLIAGVAPVIVRSRMGLDRLRTNNEVAGFKFATIGVLYAVLLGFAVIVVWGKFSEAENNVSQEAGAATTIYRIANGIGGDSGTTLREAVTGYLKAAIAEDWPAMERGNAESGRDPRAGRCLRRASETEPYGSPWGRPYGRGPPPTRFSHPGAAGQTRRGLRHRPRGLVVGPLRRRHWWLGAGPSLVSRDRLRQAAIAEPDFVR